MYHLISMLIASRTCRSVVYVAGCVIFCSFFADDLMPQLRRGVSTEAFFSALIQGDEATVRNMLSRGANVNARDHFGSSAAEIAAWSQGANSCDILRDLIRHGAAVNTSNCFGTTPLMNAVCVNNVEAVSMLLDAGANPNSQDRAGRTALHVAAASADPKIIRMLLDAGADRQIADTSGVTPADEARAEGNLVAERLFADLSVARESVPNPQ